MNKIKIHLDTNIQHLYHFLNQHGSTFLVGGYLRDNLLNKKPFDVDFVTCIPFNELKELFKNFSFTENGKKIGIGRFTYKNHLIEIQSVFHDLPQYNLNENKFLNKKAKYHFLNIYLSKKDFTINSFYYDDGFVYGKKEWFDDLQRKIIQYNEHPSTHIVRSPQSCIRSLRLSSELGFFLSDELDLYYQDIHPLHDISEQRIKSESNRILSSRFPIYSFYYLIKWHFIQSNIILPKEKIETFSHYSNQQNNTIPTHIQLFILSYYTNRDIVLDWCNFFLLSDEQIKRFILFYNQFHTIPFEETPNISQLSLPNHPIVLSDLLHVFKFFHSSNPNVLQSLYEQIKLLKQKK